MTPFRGSAWDHRLYEEIAKNKSVLVPEGLAYKQVMKVGTGTQNTKIQVPQLVDKQYQVTKKKKEQGHRV